MTRPAPTTIMMATLTYKRLKCFGVIAVMAFVLTALGIGRSIVYHRWSPKERFLGLLLGLAELRRRLFDLQSHHDFRPTRSAYA